MDYNKAALIIWLAFMATVTIIACTALIVLN